MQLYPDFNKAMNNGIDRYLQQKKDKPLYIFQVNVLRRKFFMVVSADEASKYKLSTNKADWSIGTTEASKQIWADRQKRKPDEKLKTQLDLIRGYRRYHRAQEKLAKMERGAIAPQGNEAGHYGSLTPSHP
jgi:hypothetical protein